MGFPKVVNVGQTYYGLDDLSSDCILDLQLLWSDNIALPYSDNVEHLSEYELVKEGSTVVDYIITEKGRLAGTTLLGCSLIDSYLNLNKLMNTLKG